MAEKCAKQRDARAKCCCFTNINLLLFLPFSVPSSSLLPKLPFVVILKFCYHGYETSHFSFLFDVSLISRTSRSPTLESEKTGEGPGDEVGHAQKKRALGSRNCEHGG